ncbi:MAG: hypothetical protein AB8G05_23725 [Oligoflexales bacterium]
MSCSSRVLLIICLGLWVGINSPHSKAEPFSYKKILDQETIDEIIRTKNFFGKNNYAQGEDIHDEFTQLYSQYFLKNREQIIPFNQAINYAMRSSFDLIFSFERLLQARYGQHEDIGRIIPSVNLKIADGSAISFPEAFSGLFGFLFPQNWLKIKRSNIRYDIARNTVLKAGLDSYLNIQLVFLDLHRILLNCEITSFYLCNLQILENRINISQDERYILQSLYSNLSIDLADFVNRIGIHHNNLAFAMTIITDENNNLSAKSIRADLIDAFPSELKPFEELGDLSYSKELFVQTTFEKSIEVLIASNLADAANETFGIRAIGNVLSDRSSGIDPGLGISIGYGTIPSILRANSQRREFEINVAREILYFLDTARRSYGNYGNSYLSFIEADNAITLSQRLFYGELAKLDEKDSEYIDEKFITSFQNIVRAEIQRNNVLHNGLRDKAVLRRYLLSDTQEIKRFLPSELDVDAAIGSLGKKNPLAYTQSIENYIDKLQRSKDLKRFLEGRAQRRAWTNFETTSTKDIVKEHLDRLLQAKRRSRNYFMVLKNYLEENEVNLTPEQKELLNFNLNNGRFSRIFQTSL